MNKVKVTQEVILNHLKNYGFVFQNSEIYGGLANAWDFGPLGAILKNNLKQLWINSFVTSSSNMHLIDTNIILNPSVWKASGHIDNFSDPLIDCKECKSRFRADKLIEEFTTEKVNELMPSDVLEKIILDNNIKCPNCKKMNWTHIRNFSLMFETKIGVIDDEKNVSYLRPETAQGIYINFKNIQRTTRSKLPFGVAQIGKAFRNEITPGNFIFRTREFEQMEIEFFVNDSEENKWFDYFQKKIKSFLLDDLNISKENIDIVEYDKNEIAHYAKKTVDFFYKFPHGYSELWGLCNRGQFDLNQHQKHSTKNLEYLDETDNSKFIPSVIEPSVGVERLLYAILLDSYRVDLINDEERVYLKLNYELSPYKIAILPLNNKLDTLSNSIYNYFLSNNISTSYDKSGSIGKRYRRQDAIGTYYCLTVDFDSENDNKYTLRFRDTTKQLDRLTKEEILAILQSNILKRNK
ncbi:MAG: glycine--tRNA ligase [Malacoplasma sp.]